MSIAMDRRMTALEEKIAGFDERIAKLEKTCVRLERYWRRFKKREMLEGHAGEDIPVPARPACLDFTGNARQPRAQDG